MKKRIYLLLITGMVLFLNVRAQDSPNTYLFYDFLDGTAMMKTGNSIQSKFNYNIETETITFVNTDNTILALSNPDRVVHIKIDDRMFVPGEKNIFYEKIEIPGGEYYIRWKPKNSTQGANIGYGIYSSTATTKQITRVLDSPSLLTEVKTNHEHDIEKDVQPIFYIKEGEKYLRANSVKDLTKIFKPHKASIEQFAKENKINFKKKEDVARILEYAYSLE